MSGYYDPEYDPLRARRVAYWNSLKDAVLAEPVNPTRTVEVNEGRTRYVVTTVRVDEFTGANCSGCGREWWTRDGRGGFVLVGFVEGAPLLQSHYPFPGGGCR